MPRAHHYRRARAFFGLLLFGFGLLLFGLPCGLMAQPGEAGYTLRGRVFDAETDGGVAGAHVFIASSMRGTVTDAEGRFALERVPRGAHRLYVSMLGYTAEERDVRLPDAADSVFAIALTPEVLEAPGVTVEGERDPRWPRRLRKFERLFLGETPNAKQAVILNPEVLDFEATWWGRFRARASAPLVVENHALGYRITYFLKEFESAGGTLRYDGEPLFEEMEPEDEAQAAAWAAARRTAYEGSFRHFLLALLANRYKEEGFVAYHRIDQDAPRRGGPAGFPVRTRRLLAESDRPDEKVLRFHGFIEIVYLGEDEDRSYLFWQAAMNRTPGPQHSWIKLSDGPTTVDATGEVLDPYGVTVYGYFAFERIADLVPKEYPYGVASGSEP